MSALKDEVESASRGLESVSEARERVLRLSRELVRACSKAIVDIHNGRSVDVPSMTLMRDELMTETSRYPRLATNAEQALQEYCEMLIFHTLVGEGRFPGVEECGSREAPYLLGLADAVGEMRRRCLHLKMSGDDGEAKRLLEKMWEVNDVLAGVHLPSALLPIRKKKDVVRSLVDRTQSDLLD